MTHQFVRRVTAVAVFLFAASTYAANAMAAPINGVQFKFLNTTLESIEWIIDNLGSTDAYGPSGPNGPSVIAPGTGPLVATEINNLLARYKSAGVNYIGLIIGVGDIANYCNTVGKAGYNPNQPTHFYNPNAANSFCTTNGSYPYPQLNPAITVDLNSFLAMVNSGPYAGQFKIGVMFFTQGPETGYLCGGVQPSDGTTPCPDNGDPNNQNFNQPYGNAEEYLANWINALIPTNDNIGMISLGGQLMVCNYTGCDQESSGASDMVKNNGEWIRNVWQWKQTAFPTLNANYEALSFSEDTNAVCGSPSEPELTCVASWENTYTPGVPYVSVSLYVAGNPGTLSSQYAQEGNALLNAYTSASPATPLWIEEYGGPINTNSFTAQDQTRTINGFLAASFCRADYSQTYPKFLYIASDDYNPNNPTAAQQFGIVSGFDSNGYPVMEPAWSTLGQWYIYALSNTASANGAVSTASDTLTTGSLSICGSNGEMSFSNIVQNPTHGSVTITNTTTGAFNYAPVAGFVGNDSFQFTITFPDDSISAVTTESVTVYSPSEITVVANYLVP